VCLVGSDLQIDPVAAVQLEHAGIHVDQLQAMRVAKGGLPRGCMPEHLRDIPRPAVSSRRTSTASRSAVCNAGVGRAHESHIPIRVRPNRSAPGRGHAVQATSR
jgi:hypothetical protein